MIKVSIMLGLLAVVVLVSESLSTAEAAVAYNDFGASTGALANVTTIGFDGLGGTGDLVDINTGVAFGTLTVANTGSATLDNGTATGDPSEEYYDTFNGITFLPGYVFALNPTSSIDNMFVFSGLDTSKTYDLILASDTGININNTVGFTIEAASFANVTNTSGDAVISGVNDETTTINQQGVYVAHYTDITPDANGQIIIDLIPTVGNPRVNAIRFEEIVPEPASLALLGVGGLAAMGRRHRCA